MTEELQKLYNKNIFTFEEEYIKNLKPNKAYKGNLINLADYNDLKKITQYDKSKKLIYLKADSSKIIDQKKLKKIKEIKLRTSRYLINMLCNDNQFILISSDLWKFISKEKDNGNSFSYKIDNNGNLTITFDDKVSLSFKHNNKINIINKQNINFDIIEKSNIKEINSFYESINEYYKFEKKFIDKLRQAKTKQEFGCLVEKNWLDKWLIYCNYKEIKEKNYNIESQKQEIKNKLIYDLEKNNYFKHSNLIPINIIFPEKKEQLESYLQKDSLVIVESKFCRSRRKIK